MGVYFADTGVDQKYGRAFRGLANPQVVGRRSMVLVLSGRLGGTGARASARPPSPQTRGQPQARASTGGDWKAPGKNVELAKIVLGVS